MSTSMIGNKGNIVPKGYNYGQLSQFTPEQSNLFKNMFSQVGGNSQLSGLANGDQGAFDQLEAPALRQFNELQGGIASRFSGQGLGGRKSSGFQNTMSAASRDFSSQLQSQRMGLMRQAQQDLFSMSQGLLSQRPYEQFLTEKQQKKPSFFQSILGAASPLAGAAIGAHYGGAKGAKVGGEIGSSFGNAFQ